MSKYISKKARDLTSILVLSSLFLSLPSMAEEKQVEASQLQDIKSYCLDFNWDKKGFAKPGAWKDADPEKHVNWYKYIGANVIQTFAVSCNGYAWYKSDVVPEQPGLEHDFLREVVKKGHAEGMKVMGYFCVAANTRWVRKTPLLVTALQAALTSLILTNTLSTYQPPLQMPLKLQGLTVL